MEILLVSSSNSNAITLISNEKIEEVMAYIQTKTTMEEFATNDKANYHSRIASIMVNGKRAYELKCKFLDDLRDNAFSRTSGEDAVEKIKYFLIIVDPINLSNVNYKRIRISIFLISLVGNASIWFDEFKGVAGKEFFKAEKANNDDKQETAEIFRNETNLFDYKTPFCTEFKEFNFLLKVDSKLFTHDIERTKTYEDYKNKLNDKLEEPWSKDGVPYEIYDHICEPFRFKNEKAKWPNCNSNEDRFCNREELPRMVSPYDIFQFMETAYWSSVQPNRAGFFVGMSEDDGESCGDIDGRENGRKWCREKGGKHCRCYSVLNVTGDRGE
uniref:Uncharacterized protein n=1 Tax=Tanacetum cinerariifolium TaxID=118510 RepID=A0A699GKS5_TANCI|nr:hypothetical protein [Tanacetum cinerariifolium]